MAVIKIKRGTAALVDAASLSDYEIAFETDTKKIVVYDGNTKQKYPVPTAIPTASKVPIADASGTLDAWIFGGGYLVDNTPPVDGMYISYLLVGGMVVT
jgi:hypothetical protein